MMNMETSCEIKKIDLGVHAAKTNQASDGEEYVILLEEDDDNGNEEYITYSRVADQLRSFTKISCQQTART